MGDERALFGVLEGGIEAIRIVEGIEQVVGTRSVGDVFGEVPLTLGTVFPVGFRAAGSTRVLRIEPSDYFGVAAVAPEVATKIGKLASNRIGGPGGLQGLAAEPRRRARSCSATGGIPRAPRSGTSSIATRSASDGSSRMCPTTSSSGGARCPAEDDYPTVRVVNGKTVVRPQLRRVAELLGVPTEPEAAEYDTVVVGAGPAGLAAAVYGASEGLRTIVVEREAPGGQAGTSSRIENYLGFPSGVSGEELASRALQQARRLGAEILVTRSITRVDATTLHIHLDGGDVLRARTIILACGVAWRRLSIEGFDRLSGKGIFYGAARSEAPNAHGLDVHIIGAGNSAGQAAMFFASHARSVTIVYRGETLDKSMSRYLVDQLASRPNIQVLFRTEVVAATATSPSRRSTSRTTRPATRPASTQRPLHLHRRRRRDRVAATGSRARPTGLRADRA